MKKNILLAAILINQINVKGMEGEKIEEPGILIKKDNKSILCKLGSGINNYKIEIAGGIGGGTLGYGSGRLIEHLTETTNEKGEITSGWWSRELTYGFSIITTFIGATWLGRISGKQEEKLATIKLLQREIDNIENDEKILGEQKVICTKLYRDLIEKIKNK